LPATLSLPNTATSCGYFPAIPNSWAAIHIVACDFIVQRDEIRLAAPKIRIKKGLSFRLTIDRWLMDGQNAPDLSQQYWLDIIYVACFRGRKYTSDFPTEFLEN